MAGRAHADLQELEGMELDEDLALPLAPGIDGLTHRISVARLQHISNLAWCLGSWLPHLVSLAVLLIRMVRGNAIGFRFCTYAFFPSATIYSISVTFSQLSPST